MAFVKGFKNLMFSAKLWCKSVSMFTV